VQSALTHGVLEPLDEEAAGLHDDGELALPTDVRTAGYFSGCGLGSVRRWPHDR
jgi:hypothetical protein